MDSNGGHIARLARAAQTLAKGSHPPLSRFRGAIQPPVAVMHAAASPVTAGASAGSRRVGGPYTSDVRSFCAQLRISGSPSACAAIRSIVDIDSLDLSFGTTVDLLTTIILIAKTDDDYLSLAEVEVLGY